MISTDIVEKLEELKNSSACNIGKLQAGLLPVFISKQWESEPSYTLDGQEIYVTDIIGKLVLKVDLLFKPVPIQKKRFLVYKKSMMECYNNNLVHPFLVFVNGIFVRWDDVEIVRDYKFTYIIINHHPRIVGSFKKVDIINLPFEVSYLETGIELIGYTPLFRFNNNCRMSNVGNIIISTRNPKILYYGKMHTDEAIKNVCLPVDVNYKLNKDNLIIFKDGILCTDLNVEIKNLNILTINNGNYLAGNTHYSVYYNTYSNLNISNALIPINSDYVKSLVTNTSVHKLNVDELERDFNFDFVNTKSYDKNVSDALGYMFEYNEANMNSVYRDRSCVTTRIYSGLEIRALLDSNNNLTMHRFIYKEKETFVMIFLNGVLHSQYSGIVYDSNTFTINVPNINNTDIMEFVYFRDVNNYVVETKISENNNYIMDRAVYPNDAIILSNSTHDNIYDFAINDRTLYNVDFSVNNRILTLSDPFYYDKPVYIVSKNQFRYVYYNIFQLQNSIKLSTEFRTCLNKDRYMVFINGRMINKVMYKLLIEEHDNPFVEPCIYSKILLRPGDKIEVFYVPVDLNYIHPRLKVIMDQRKTNVSVKNQMTFKIPYPYKDYEEGFVVSVGSVFISPDRYTIVGDSIIFTEKPIASEIIFIFIYTVVETLPFNGDPVKDDFIRIESRNVIATASAHISTRSAFLIPSTCQDGFIISVGSVFIDPSRYYIIGGYVVFVDNCVDLGLEVTFMFARRNSDNNYITLNVIPIVATTDKQISFTIPTNCKNSFILSIGTTFIAQNRYEIVGNVLTFVNPNDGVAIGNIVSFIYAISDFPVPECHTGVLDKPYMKWDISSTVSEIANQYAFYIPFLYEGCNYTKDSFILNVGSVFIDSNRYEITGDIITFTEPIARLGTVLTFITAYKTNEDPDAGIDKLTGTEYLITETESVVATTNNQMTFEVPIIDLYHDIEFIVTVGSVIIDPDRYIVDRDFNTVTFTDANDGVALNNSVMFTFVYSNNYIPIRKDVNNVKASIDNQVTFDIPVPFDNYLDIVSTKFIVTVGSVYVDKLRYVVNKTNKTLTFINHDIAIPKGNTVSFIFFYITDNRRAMNVLSESGYVYTNKDDNVFDKNLYFLFVNGKKADLTNIMDISRNVFRVKRDMYSRFNMCILDFAPRVQEFEELLKEFSSWDDIVFSQSVETLNVLMDIRTRMTNIEPYIRPNISETEIVREIIAAYYTPNGISKGARLIREYELKDTTNKPLL